MLLRKSRLRKLDAILREKSRFLLATPAPDGDSIGSLLALAHYLDRLGKEVALYVGEAISPSLHFLPGHERFSQTLSSPPFDVLLVADTGHSSRLFGDQEARWLGLAGVTVNIDHHEGCDEFAHLNILDTSAAAVAEILLDFFDLAGVTVTREMAVCLQTSLIADTGGFKYPNVTPRTLSAAARFLELGAEPYPIVRSLYAAKRVPSLKLSGLFYTSLRSEREGRLVWGRLTRRMFEESGALDEEAEKMVEELDVLAGVQVYCLFKENADGSIKVSLRSRSSIPVRDVALAFGGGGHVQAAGCRLDGPIEAAEARVLAEVRRVMGGDP